MINKTSDYSLFKKHEMNRDIDESNLKRIKNSIKARNLLDLRPILVNKDFKVIDGQHRLQAAVELQLPVFYQIQETSHEEDIILLNANQKRWTLRDYFTYFLNNNLPEYVKLKNYIDKHKSELMLCLAVLKQSNTSYFADFRKGNYQFPEQTFELTQRFSFLKNVQEFLYKKVTGQKKFIYQTTFVRSFLTFINYEAVDLETFMKKIELKVDWFRPCSKYLDYIELFKNIYNFKNNNPIGLFDPTSSLMVKAPNS